MPENRKLTAREIGEIAENWAVERLSMEKSSQGKKGFDGWWTGPDGRKRKLQVKAKQIHSDSDYYKGSIDRLNDYEMDTADDLFLVLHKNGEVKDDIGPVSMNCLKTKATKSKPKYKYNLTIQKIRECESVNVHPHEVQTETRPGD